MCYKIHLKNFLVYSFQGTDQALLTKTNMSHSNNNYFLKYKSELTLAFGIRHFAGTVSYNVEGMTFCTYTHCVTYTYESSQYISDIVS